MQSSVGGVRGGSATARVACGEGVPFCLFRLSLQAKNGEQAKGHKESHC